MLKPATRATAIAPFEVMRILARAKALEAEGRDIVHMEVGEPRFPLPERLLEAARRSLASEPMGYTSSLGLPLLRRAIAARYGDRYGIDLDPARVIVTTGASGALMLALMALLEPGSPVMVTEPGYPCHRHMASVSGGTVYATALSPESGWCLGAAGVAGDWQAGTRVLMLTTPGNPTGAVLGISELAEVVDEVRGRGAAVIVDESYQGLVYDAEDVSALACGAAGVFVVNSFSKYFGLTGWRLGWLVVPPGWAPIIERLAQNLYLAPPTLSQHLALEALKPSMQAQLADRRQDLRARRDLLLGALPRLGLALPSAPQGAFYAFIGMPAGHADAASFAEALLEGVDVAVTPGTDFGGLVAAGMLRVAYTESAPRLRIGLDRIGEFLDAA